MIEKKGQFFTGIGLMASFIIVLIIIFMPIFNGQNGLNYMDSLYNSISKGSAYYIPKVREESQPFNDNLIDVKLGMATNQQSEQSALLFLKGNAAAKPSGNKLVISGDLGQILANCLTDADIMYHNDGKSLSEKYGYDGKRVLFNWWMSLSIMGKELKAQKKYKEAKMVAMVVKKAVETSFNYYEIDAQKISDKYGIVIISLIFYVIYTLWYGFAILFMFEGWGLKLEH